MLTESILSILVAGLIGLLLVVGGFLASRAALRRARSEAARLLDEARVDAENQKKEQLLAAQEKLLVLEEETDRRERELESRENRLESGVRELERERTELSRRQRQIERGRSELARSEQRLAEALKQAEQNLEQSRRTLERVAGLDAEQARSELIAGIEKEAHKEGARLARKIKDEARESAEREALNLMVRAAERVRLNRVVESTVNFIELPTDEMKGRIIGREGRNIRALEMATGIDLIVDDTPRAILISSFDPMRREVARVAIQRLIEDGRIHPARIEEVVARVREELRELVEQEGNQAAFQLGIPDLHPKLARLVGRLKFNTNHGQNLLQHSLEVALLTGHMASEIGARVELGQRAALLHEIGRVDDTISGHTAMASAELAARFGEAEPVVLAIKSLHPDVEASSLEAVLLGTANRLSDNRPGARKDNLEIFIERLRRLEKLVLEFSGVDQAYAVKSGKEIRVIVDAGQVSDEQVEELCKQVARRIEKELAFPGQIKVSVIRETRAVRFAV